MVSWLRLNVRLSLLTCLDESLLRMQEIHAIKRPTKRNQKSLANFISNTGSQAVEESDWIRIGVDLAAVAHDQEHGWLITFLEDTLLKISRKAAVVSHFCHCTVAP